MSSIKGLTILETLLVLFIIGALMLVVLSRYQRLTMEAREAALKAGLTHIRLSIKLFKALNNRHPRDLKELLEKDVILPARIGSDPYTGSFFKEKYLTALAQDAKGNILDPFGRGYVYDDARGEVKSSTKGYEQW